MSNQTTSDQFARHEDGSRLNGLKVLLNKIKMTTIDSEGNKILNWTTFHRAEKLNQDCILGLQWC
jgi:hypothetical protein